MWRKRPGGVNTVRVTDEDSKLIDLATDVADKKLFPDANDVDQAGTIPSAKLDLLAEAGLYGLFSPSDVGGLGADITTVRRIHETIAGGCLTTAFVWTQHGGPARAAAMTDGPMHDAWARRLASGEARGGVAFAHLLRPGTPLISATETSDGWKFTGTAPFVSGWGNIDVVLTAARHGDDVVWALLDTTEGPTLRSNRLRLAAIDSSMTVELRFAEHPVRAEQITLIESFDDWFTGYRAGLRTNGSLALGITGRCLRLLGPSPLDQGYATARSRLDNATTQEMPAARSEAATFAVTAASALVASVGGSAVMLDNHAQRLAREATFLLVQGQTPEIKQQNIMRLTGL
jgi:alkylation response protein AidB-like acyl-CoA dehydrogenase